MSLSATVIPAPVTGCRMFKASPSRTIPSVLFRVDGIQEFGMLLRRPFRIARSNAGRTVSGTVGATHSSRYNLTASVLPSLSCTESGISTRILVSRFPIGYIKTGGPLPMTEWAYLGIDRCASSISRPQNRETAFGLWGVNCDRKLDDEPSAKMVKGARYWKWSVSAQGTGVTRECHLHRTSLCS